MRSPGKPGFLFGGLAFNEVTANMIAEFGSGTDWNRAGGGNFDGGIDDVFFPVTLAGGDVAEQRVTASMCIDSPVGVETGPATNVEIQRP
jgi:hypothetical protein